MMGLGLESIHFQEPTITIPTSKPDLLSAELELRFEEQHIPSVLAIE